MVPALLSYYEICSAAGCTATQGCAGHCHGLLHSWEEAGLFHLQGCDDGRRVSPMTIIYENQQEELKTNTQLTQHPPPYTSKHWPPRQVGRECMHGVTSASAAGGGQQSGDIRSSLQTSISHHLLEIHLLPQGFQPVLNLARYLASMAP